MADDVRVVAQPAGTVTLVFTDVEGSTRLLRELGRDAYLAALDEQRGSFGRRARATPATRSTTSGDGFFYAFASAGEAVAAVEEAMADLAESTIRIRAGIHTGEPGLDPPKYVGQDVHKAARIMGAGHGGQVLLSQATRGLVDGLDVRDLGEHRLKDFDEPVRLFQLGTAEFPPLKTLSNTNLPVPTSSFVGRERELAEVDVAASRRRRSAGHARRARRLGEDATRDRGRRRGDRRLPGRRLLGRARQPARPRARRRHGRAGARREEPSLAEQIGDRTLLVVLDNFEHVIDAAAELSALLRRVPQPASAGDEP